MGIYTKHVKFASSHFTVCWWAVLLRKQELVLTLKWTYSKDSDEVVGNAQPGAKGTSIKWVLTKWPLSFRLLCALIHPAAVFPKGNHSWEKNVGEQTLPEIPPQVVPCCWRDGAVCKQLLCVGGGGRAWVPRTPGNIRGQEGLNKRAFQEFTEETKGLENVYFSKNRSSENKTYFPIESLNFWHEILI